MISDIDTIAAVATPSGVGAIAVIRISGPRAWAIASVVSRISGEHIIPRRATLRGVFNKHGEEIDRALITCFSSPHSFTGEDSAEISCHGGYAASRAVFQAVTDAGARSAEPGEFTKRAFLNGKMDLAQAEAINQLIRARTDVQMIAAKQTLDGALSRRIREASEHLTGIAAGLEASIDFPDDVDEPDRHKLECSLEAVAAVLSITLELAQRGQILSSGVRLAIVGRPNVGKSSLLNLLAGRARAIVSELPGTTRDFLEETVDIGGVPVLAIDTAGLRDTLDPIEKEGTKRALDVLTQADVGLIVVDASVGITPDDQEVISDAGDKAIVVLNKIDLLGRADLDEVSKQHPSVKLSALTGEGLADLKSIILQSLGAGAGYFEEALAANQRQVTALQQALECVEGAARSVRSSFALDLAAVQIQSARARLAEITGENALESLLDSIFASFCIGK